MEKKNSWTHSQARVTIWKLLRFICRRKVRQRPWAVCMLTVSFVLFSRRAPLRSLTERHTADKKEQRSEHSRGKILKSLGTQETIELWTHNFPLSILSKNETWKLDTTFLLSGVRGKRKSENHVRSNFRRFTQPSRTRKETALLFAFLLVKDFRGRHESSHFTGRRATATHF